MGGDRCPFTSAPCDGGAIHDGGSVGCAYKASPESPCDLMADVPFGVNPRDWLNSELIELSRSIGNATAPL